MDPDRALRRLTELANRVVQGDPEQLEWDRLVTLATELAETILALDEWLRRGGFRPSAWKMTAPGERA